MPAASTMDQRVVENTATGAGVGGADGVAFTAQQPNQRHSQSKQAWGECKSGLLPMRAGLVAQNLKLRGVPDFFGQIELILELGEEGVPGDFALHEREK